MAYRPPYGPPGGAPPTYGAAPAYGAPGAPPTGAAPPASRPGPAFMNPAGGPAVPPNSFAPPAGAPPGAPGGYAPPPSGAPATGFYQPPGAAAPPTYGAPPAAAPAYGAPPAAAPYGAPPSSAYGAPAPVAAAPPSAKPSVQFFSTAGGAVQPAATNFAPPQAAPSTMGMPPPPTNVGAPMSMPPPPTGGAPFMAPPGAPGAPPAMAGPPSVAPPQYSAAYGMAAPQPPNSMAGMPTGFDGGANLATTPGGAPAIPGQASDPNSGSLLPTLDEIDLSVQCNPNFLRASVSKIVGSQTAANNARIPLGIVCKPMAGDKGITNDEIEVVDFGSTGIIRCKRCRTYINPYVSWTDNGRRWRCNICGMLNDVPSNYFSHLDARGQRRDRDQRPELNKASVEFVAPGDYMVRPPVPPVYFFVIDVSEPSITSGMIQNCVNAIKSSLDELPGNPRTQVGFITFDSHIHFYNLKSSLSSPQMLVVSDITDVIMPLPEDLLVNLNDSRAVVDTLLDSLPAMFKSGSSSSATCTGPALMAAKRVIQHIGGKLLLFQSSLPSIGEGSLKMRENPRLLGTDKEHTLLNPEDPWYKTNAIEFSRIQVAVDTFLFGQQYTDLATISTLSKYTGGSTYYYPGFVSARDGTKFEKELSHDLTRATAFEAVMRVRATRGLRFTNFYGNYFIRGTDLLALPNCTSDSTFSLDLAYDEAQLSAQVITIQAALLYTNSTGERRIRVHTMVLPVTHSVPDMIESLDIDCAMNLLSKQAVDIATKTGLENARQRIHQTTVEIMRAARAAAMTAVTPGPGGYHMPGQMPQQQQPQASPAYGGNPLPQSLLLLPLYAMSLQKSLVLRGGSDVRTDERAYFQQLLLNMDIEETKVFIYPRMFSIHDMGNDIGVPSDNADDDVPTAGPFQVRLPNILNLSYERLTSEGIFLLENGHDMFMWIGRGVNPAIVSTLFGVPSLDGVDITRLSIMSENSDFSSRANAVVVALREDRPSRYMQLHFIREGDGYAEAYFARYLIEDRANFSGGGLSYTEYHAHVSRSMG